jgi:hypothetical protein
MRTSLFGLWLASCVCAVTYASPSAGAKHYDPDGWRGPARRPPASGTYVADTDSEHLVLSLDGSKGRWYAHVRRANGTCWLFGTSYISDETMPQPGRARWVITSFAMNAAQETTDPALDKQLSMSAAAKEAYYHCRDDLWTSTLYIHVQNKALVATGANESSGRLYTLTKVTTADPSSVPRGFYCYNDESNQALSVCARTEASCEVERDDRFGHSGSNAVLAACMPATSAECFQDGRCAATEEACKAQRDEIVSAWRPQNGYPPALADCSHWE